MRHGPHQAAQKSTSTGKRDWPTTASNSLDDGTSVGSAGAGSSVWQFPQRTDWPR